MGFCSPEITIVHPVPALTESGAEAMNVMVSVLTEIVPAVIASIFTETRLAPVSTQPFG